MNACSVQLLTTATVNLQHLDHGGDVPDVGEGDVGEFTAPFSGDTDATKEGVEHVANVFITSEAFVGEAPHTVHRVSSIWLREDVLERDLKGKIRFKIQDSKTIFIQI